MIAAIMTAWFSTPITFLIGVAIITILLMWLGDLFE